MATQVTFLNTRFDRMSQDEAIQTLLDSLLRRQSKTIFYANAHTMVTAAQNEQLAAALHRCDMLLADGSGVRWGSAMLGTPLTYNLNGTDLVPALCQAGAQQQLSVYLLGGKPGVAEDAARNLQASCPGLKIVGSQHGYFQPEELSDVLENIRRARPHLLLVALGVPHQEIWIDQHAAALPGISCMGVGGLFDFLAQRVARAPQWVRAVGMEWSWRLLMEPGRLWRRYLVGNAVFISLVTSYAFFNRTPALPIADPVRLYEYSFAGEQADGEVLTDYNQIKSA